jgi:hypothetical protein
MDNSASYGQIDFNLPHDVVSLPSQGLFYNNKKKSVKVGYLTAQDENVLASSLSSDESIIISLLKNKIYEPDLRVHDLLEGDVEAILIFLRNTAFGPEYNFNIKDPKTGTMFNKTILLDEINIKHPSHKPNEKGLFEFVLPKSNANVECRLLTMGDTEELRKLEESYPKGMVAPVVTNRLLKQIVSVNGNDDKDYISKFILSLPIMDSKFIRSAIVDCEPRLDLNNVVTAPSGELVNVKITFGAEFFRPFF